jgi:hypothetical protein
VELPEAALAHRYCLLTTRTRVSDRSHTAELWFAPAPGGVYLMSGSGGLTSWFLNLQTEEEGVLRIGDLGWQVRASFPERDDPEREAALRAFDERYDGGRDGRDGRDGRVEAWLRDAVVAHLVLVRALR